MPNFNRAAIEVWGWMSNFILHYTGIMWLHIHAGTNISPFSKRGPRKPMIYHWPCGWWWLMSRQWRPVIYNCGSFFVVHFSIQLSYDMDVDDQWNYNTSNESYMLYTLCWLYCGELLVTEVRNKGLYMYWMAELFMGSLGCYYFQHWSRWWLGAVQATTHYLNQWWNFVFISWVVKQGGEINNRITTKWLHKQVCEYIHYCVFTQHHKPIQDDKKMIPRGPFY